MNGERKTRPDAVLRNLPEARQDAIGAMMLPGPDNKSLAEIQKSLADDGIQVSQNALSRWFSWWGIRRQRQLNEEFTESLQAELKEQQPEISDAELFAYGQRIFSRLALQQEDPKQWASIQYVSQGAKKLQIDSAKLEELKRRNTQLEEELRLAVEKHQRETCDLFIKWFADKQAAQILASGAGNSEKIKALRQLMFPELHQPTAPPTA